MDRLTQGTGDAYAAIADLRSATEKYTQLIGGTADAQNAASASIVADTRREYEAKADLFRLELQRQKLLQVERQQALVDVSNDVNRMDLQFEAAEVGDGNFLQNIATHNSQFQREFGIALDNQTRLRAEVVLNGVAITDMETVLAGGMTDTGGGSGGGTGDLPATIPPGTGGSSGGGNSTDSYTDLIAKINQRIAAQTSEAEALALTAREADKLRAAREFLTMAERAGLELTPELRAEIDMLAEAYVNAADEAKNRADAELEAQQNINDMRGDISSAIKQMIGDLREGKSALESFLVIWQSFIAKITDRAIDNAVDAMFPNTSGGGGNSGGGGGLMNVLGKVLGFDSGGAFSGGGQLPINNVSSGPVAFNMGGGNLGVMGERRPEAIMPLVRNAAGDLAVQAVGGGGGGNSHTSFDVRVITSDPNTKVQIRPSARQARRHAQKAIG
ncbi:MAG: phage tail tape measure protein [Rhodobacteraceae bacterium]|nr:phage tail tape measure protein [Paracoccaceae bacterium]